MSILAEKLYMDQFTSISIFDEPHGIHIPIRIQNYFFMVKKKLSPSNFTYINNENLPFFFHTPIYRVKYINFKFTNENFCRNYFICSLY